MTWTGNGSAWGIGPESTFATPVSRTVWFALSGGESMAEKVATSPRKTLVGGGSSRMPRASYVTGVDAGGGVSIHATYEGMGLLLAYALGGDWNTTGPSGGLYTHTLALADDLPVGLTSEIIRGDSGLSEIFPGGQINKLTLKVTAGEEMTADVDLIAQRSLGRDDPSEPSWTGSRDLTVSYAEVGVTFDGTEVACNSLTFSIDNKLVRRRELKSDYTKRPRGTDFIEVMITLEMTWQSDVLYSAYRARNTGDTVITLTGTGGRTLTITAEACRIMDCTAPIGSMGEIKQTATLRAYAAADDSSQGLTVVLVNTQSDPLAA